MNDPTLEHEIANLRAERDAAIRQLGSAIKIVRSLIADEAESLERAETWCDRIDRVIDRAPVED